MIPDFVVLLIGLIIGVVAGFYYGRLWVLVQLKSKPAEKIIERIVSDSKPRKSPPQPWRPQLHPVRVIPPTDEEEVDDTVS